MSRCVSKLVLGSFLALAAIAPAWARGTSGGLGVGIHIAYHTPPTAKDGLFDASNPKLSGTLAAVPAAPGQTFVFSIVTQPAHGTVTLLDAVAGTFTYLPNTGFKNGVDSFTFQAVDSHGLESNIATETLLFHVSTRALESQVSIPPNTTANGFLTADPAFPGELLTYQVLQVPSVGVFHLLDVHTGAFTYTPPIGFTGGVTVKFQVMDPLGVISNSDLAHVLVTAEPPVASAGSFSTIRNLKFTGTLSAHTVFTGQKLSYHLVKQALHGTVVITNIVTGQFTYTPKTGYVGADSFQFRALDQNNTPSNTAIAAVTVH